MPRTTRNKLVLIALLLLLFPSGCIRVHRFEQREYSFIYFNHLYTSISISQRYDTPTSRQKSTDPSILFRNTINDPSSPQSSLHIQLVLLQTPDGYISKAYPISSKDHEVIQACLFNNDKISKWCFEDIEYGITLITSCPCAWVEFAYFSSSRPISSVCVPYVPVWRRRPREIPWIPDFLIHWLRSWPWEIMLCFLRKHRLRNHIAERQKLL